MSEPRETLWPIYFDAGGGRWVSFDEPVVVTDRSSAAVRGHLAGLTVAGPGRDGGFFKIADFLERRGVLVHFVPVRVHTGAGGERPANPGQDCDRRRTVAGALQAHRDRRSLDHAGDHGRVAEAPRAEAG